MFNKLQAAVRGQVPEEDFQYPSLVHAIESVDSKTREIHRKGYFPVHVSTAINFCARQHFLIDHSERTYTRGVTSADRVLWAIGKAIEKHNRESLIEAYGRHNVYGKWTCKCEFLVTFGLGRDPLNKPCPHCKKSVLTEYHELPLKMDNLLIGNPDLMIMRGEPKKLAIVEFKSIKKDDFDKLVSPSADYKMQAYSYVKLLEHNIEKFRELGVEPDLEKYHIIYTSKGYKFPGMGSVHKEFEINVSKLPKSFTDTFDEIIKDLRLAENMTSIPPRTICANASCETAKKCPVAGDCFNNGD